MNYCQFRTDAIKRMANAGGVTPILPPEYQQVEYIKSVGRYGYTDGTALPLIRTGVTYFADFEIDTQLAGTYNAQFCGSGGNYCLKIYSSSEPYYSLWNGSGIYYKTNIQINQRAKIRWKNNRVYIDDSYIADFEKTNTVGSYFDLFTADEVYKYAGIYIYKFTAWDNDGNIIRDMYPCYRKSDNVVGLYDSITQNINVGIVSSYWGWFETGPEVSN